MSKTQRPHPLYELTNSRIREFVREPEAIFWVFVFPVLLAFGLGIAFRSMPAQKSRVAVEKETPGAQRIGRMLSSRSDLQVMPLYAADARQALRVGKVDLVVTEAGKSADHPDGNYVFRFDPSRPESRIARMLTDSALETGLGRKDLAWKKDDLVTEPGSRYIDFLIPGLIGMNLMGSGMWGIGFNVVNARSRRLLKRFAATPMRRSHYLLSFMLSRLVFLVVEVAALVAFGWIVFDVQVRGSLLTFSFVSLLGSFTFAGLGLMVASRVTTIEAVSGWMNFIMLPMYLLSGSFFSYERFPEFSHKFIRLLPLTALNDALRLVMNEGASITSLGVETAVLLFWCVVSFVIAVKIFKWQ
jgi:ABC-2 type transport system permease protein